MAESKTAWEQASDWFGRTIAIVLTMVAPGAFGSWLDAKLGTEFLTPVGFILGLITGMLMLTVFTRIKRVENDGPIMTNSIKRESSPVLGEKAELPPVKLPPGKPSETSLPRIPGAEEFEEPQRDE